MSLLDILIVGPSLERPAGLPDLQCVGDFDSLRSFLMFHDRDHQTFSYTVQPRTDGSEMVWDIWRREV